MVEKSILEYDIKLPLSGVKLEAPNTRFFINEKECGKGGLLCVAESNLIWRQDDGSGLCLEYPMIGLHAISNDLSAFPHECLYLIVDKENLQKEESNEEEEDEDEDVIALRFVPQERALISQLFQAINECQALYPDEQEIDDEQQEHYDEDQMNEVEEKEEEGESDEAYEEGFKKGHFDDALESGEFFDANSDLTNIQLSTRGQSVLKRININYEPQDELDPEKNEQYADAEK